MEEYQKQAWDLVKAQAQVRALTPDATYELFREFCVMTKAVFSESGNDVSSTDPMSSVQHSLAGSFANVPQEMRDNPKKSIGTKFVTCLVCGKTGHMISNKHLNTHGMTIDQYNAHFGLAHGTKLICKQLQKKRSETMQKNALWERRRKPQE